MAKMQGITGPRNRSLLAVMILGTSMAAMVLAQKPQAASRGRQKGAGPEARAKEEIIELEHRWLHAGQTGDVATLNRILASDMMRPYPAGGEFVGKREMIEYARSHGSPHPVGLLPKFGQLRIWIYGQTAIARGILVAKNAQGTVIHKSLFTDVFVRRQGHWQAVSAQENSVPNH